jgi:rod shape-determining protein MreC
MLNTKFRKKSFTSARALPFDFMSGKLMSIFLVLLSFLFITASVINPSFFQGARTSVVDGITPILKAVNAPFQGAADFVGGVSGLTNLRAENAKLQAENVRLREWYQTALMLQAENQSLQALLNVKVDAPHQYVTAKVVSDSGNSFVKTVLVGVGRVDGVQKNQAVLAGEGLVGRVIEVGKNSSRIMLITDFNSRIPVLLEGTRQKAVLAGSNRIMPVLKYIPEDSIVNVGTRIITSGDGGIFPSGLPVGRIETVSGNKMQVQPFTDIGNITNVRIVNMDINPNLSSGALDN